MKLSISNIAWANSDDFQVYKLMKKYEYCGLEIAPTKIISETPYDKKEQAKVWSKKMKQEYDFDISSMQSIWFGRQERLFGTQEERKVLLEYTKKAIDFAEVIGCRNLVFGCPKNRNIPEGVDSNIAVQFFKELGEYAVDHGTVIGMEANPPIYNTNYINDTLSALKLVEEVNSRGFLLNLDIGTMIQNNEPITELDGKVYFINHVHISEPGLKPIKKRNLHKELKKLLFEENYSGFISIEMSNLCCLSNLEEKLDYVRSIFE